MTSVQTLTVSEEERDIRLDRWFRKHYPTLAHGRLEKLLRTGQVRLDGKRATASDRVQPQQVVRVPPLNLEEREAGDGKDRVKFVTKEESEWIQSLVLYRDEAIIAIDKPAGMAVQGGTGTTRHIDGMLDALRFGYEERPRLVHRLDRDTSGVLLLARTARVAAILAKSFQTHETEKTYWAVVAGLPKPEQGVIDLDLMKSRNQQGQEMIMAANGIMRLRSILMLESQQKPDDETNRVPDTKPSKGHRARQSDSHSTADSQPQNHSRAQAQAQSKPESPTARSAVTRFRTIDRASNRAAWLELTPLTGRTHQVRVHCAAMGTPIIGDAKYGGAVAFLPGLDHARQLHLHARRLVIPHPLENKILEIVANLPPHMQASWELLGFSASDAEPRSRAGGKLKAGAVVDTESAKPPRSKPRDRNDSTVKANKSKPRQRKTK